VIAAAGLLIGVLAGAGTTELVARTSLVVAELGAEQLRAAQEITARRSGRERDPTWTFASGGTMRLFPAGDAYPAYVADVHHPTNGLLVRHYSQMQIPGTSRRRTGLSAGGRFGLLRVDTASPSRRSWQVSFDAGLDALFDSEYSDTAIGWDGNYGVTATTASQGPWAFKIAWLHVSAHVGDEYEDRLARRRIDYTREEIAAGVSWQPSPRWRTYGEVGRSFVLNNEEQAPWRLEQGLEYESPKFWGGRFAWFGAGDLSSMEERAWRIDRTVQTGMVTRAAGRTYRILMEYTKGRPSVSEFFRQTESAFSYGLRIEL
jgi:hypothetical protein